MGEVILKTNDLTVDFKVRKNIFGKADRLSAVQNVNIEIKKGDCIGQAIFMPFLIADGDIAEGARTGGFGSTNK